MPGRGKDAHPKTLTRTINVRIVRKDCFMTIPNVCFPYRKFFKINFPVLILIILSGLAGCNGNEIQVPDTPLEGQISGAEWNYKSANGYLISSDFQYRVRFLSDKESVKNPCTLPNPSRTHVSAVFYPSVGSFFIAPQLIDDNQVQVSFELSISQKLIATSGFMEIYAIDSQVATGYLQATLDEENTIGGRFEIHLCN